MLSGTSVCRFVSITLILVAAVSTLQAQTTGTIVGQITDAAGAAVPAAAVEAQNIDTGTIRSAVTNDDGTYVVPSLQPGTYRIHVQHTGFKGFTQTGIKVEVGQNPRVDARLEVGAVTEVVDVSANVVAVDTQ